VKASETTIIIFLVMFSSSGSALSMNSE